MLLSGMVLLQAVAERIIARYLEGIPGVQVEPADGYHSLGGRGADLVYVADGQRTSVKIKPDSYFGTDANKVRERAWSFYREDAGVCALEAVAGSSMRDPGWMFTSDADEIFYYYLAIAQPEDEVRALVAAPDAEFFSALKVERDDLLVLPMKAAREWFSQKYEQYPSRPVALGGGSAWYRLMPRAELEADVDGVVDRGPIFSALS